ncbi:AAA domain-containing protein [Verrucomicrobiota bacterium sgz303538]
MILQTMLNRLYASLVHGPSMNARPHASRQRIDLFTLEAFQGRDVHTALADLLAKGTVDFAAKTSQFEVPDYPEEEWSDEQKKARTAYERQRRLLDKLRGIAVDAQDYYNDHGESALALGFPLLALPPHEAGRGSAASGRVVAPIAFVPLEMQVRLGSRAGITLRCLGEGSELLVPNPALLAWLEQQTGESVEHIFQDEDGSDPWRELGEILAYVTRALKLEPAPQFDAGTQLSAIPETAGLPKTAALLPNAVLGLFPLVNQAALRDTRWMIENEREMCGPVVSFLRPEALAPESSSLPEAEEFTVEEQAKVARDFGSEWLVTHADPCQAAAVYAARSSRALVVHGPPGTGKSQTIANMIGDHLARGERVLFVCDKRTALDVVKYRLDALGLGDLCGVVHDPTLDRRDLYMQLRSQLEKLAETTPSANPEAELAKVNGQLQSLHQELTAYRSSLHVPGPDGQSFHDLLGSWLELVGDESLPALPPVPQLRLPDIDAQRTALDEILRRSGRANFANNPFRQRLGVALGDFLARDPAEWNEALTSVVEVCKGADEQHRPDLLSLDPAVSLPEQAAARREVADLIERLVGVKADDLCRQVSSAGAEALGTLERDLVEVAKWYQVVETGALDRELEMTLRSAPPSLAEINQRVQALETYQPIAGSWKRLFAFGLKKAARAVLEPLALPLDVTGVERGLRFYRGLRARMLLSDFLQRAAGTASPRPWLEDSELSRLFNALGHALRVRTLIAQPSLQVVAAAVVEALQALSAHAEGLIVNLRASATWADAIQTALEKATSIHLFNQKGIEDLRREGEAGHSAVLAEAWQNAHGQLEDMVRIEHSLGAVPETLRSVSEHLAAEGMDLETALAVLRRSALENTLRERLRTEPALAAIDGDRIEAAFATFLQLSSQKQALVRACVNHRWLSRQRQRLLSATGSQLNKHGAALRQRLFVKGKRALKLRQMVATGAGIEGGDPLFDLCPVWMASPATVAQVFPREPSFDVVIFDEASQCRLEEALPVLLRGKRVVVAGDPKQLPPTRFFESGVSDSSQTDPETGEELFQQQQSEAEDLLSAALNLDVREAFLDVHYRSRNEALIGFSNETFYHERLQPIPGHPKNRATRAPILLHRVDGIYTDRSNRAEAERAANIVAELLAEKEPPSVGIACFNLTQRDMIVEVLDERAEKDADFARRLGEAKRRRGRDSFEGLFVKNLENVQGDERDVMIICTTFGPDKDGKFRRNFGALSQQTGGRRLNVLVTRARTAIHLITSIPRTEYISPQPLEEGRQPSGRHHLYSYLRYAERLQGAFESYTEALEKMQRDRVPELQLQNTPTPSVVAKALGRTLHQRHAIGGTVHWGNEGFCVDVALTHPEMPVDVTIGLLTDFTRFRKTPDPIEWDLFRTIVLRSQGWQLERLWSPALFRNGPQLVARIAEKHHQVAKQSEQALDVALEGEE